MNKNIIIFITLLALMAIVLITDLVLQNGPLTKNATIMSVVSINESSDIYTVNAAYPQFRGMDVLNQKIADLVKNHVKDFKKNSDDTWKAMNETASGDYPLPVKSPEMFYDQVTWEPVQVNNKYISIVLNVSYFSGGAHGSEEIYTFNYDVVKKEIITSEKLLNSSQEVLDKIAKLAKEYITSELKNREVILDESLSQMVSDGTKATYENYKDFTFDSNRIEFYFQKYQVAPGVAGSFTFTIFKSTLKTNNIEIQYLK